MEFLSALSAKAPYLGRDGPPGRPWIHAVAFFRSANEGEPTQSVNGQGQAPAPDTANPRSLALFQISFYGFLQECLVRMQD